jgi:pyridoxamine 5'-phosphate oxidase family protein
VSNPVGFEIDPDLGVIDIRGPDLGLSRKFHNIAADGQVAFVVDDIASLDPRTVRCLEVRGLAETLTNQPAPNPYITGGIIGIRPRRIISWGPGPDGQESSRRNIDHRGPR